MSMREAPGVTPTIPELANEAALAARRGVRVLITGESGVGKQTLARTIHERSGDAAAPWIATDCSQASDSAFEAQWMDRAADGWLEQARGGTIFIRGLETMTPRQQSALFRHLDTLHAARDGANRPSTQTRLVAAGSSSLLEAVKAGRFREDLFYRLNTVHVCVQPLRERRQEIRPLLEGFLRDIARGQGRTAPSVSEDAMRRLMGYAWPGNVRQLKATAEYMLSQQHGGIIDIRVLPPQILADPAGRAARRGFSATTLRALSRPRQRRDIARPR